MKGFERQKSSVFKAAKQQPQVRRELVTNPKYLVRLGAAALGIRGVRCFSHDQSEDQPGTNYSRCWSLPGPMLAVSQQLGGSGVKAFLPGI